MIKNYLKSAVRNLLKQRTHSLINIAGLTVGMTVFILILSYIWHELSFDRFHSKSDQIYRVVQTRIMGERESHNASTGNLLAQALKEEYPEILHVARIRHKTDVDLRYGGASKLAMSARDYLRADPSIFHVFDIPLLSGDPKTALNDLHSIVLTEGLAKELYGDEDPMGRSITITRANTSTPAFYSEDTEHTVTGIAKAVPGNSHFNFRFLIRYVDSEDWYTSNFVGTYLVLPDDYPPATLEEKFPGFIRKYFAPEIEDVQGISYDEWMKSGGKHLLKLQALSDIHMDSYYYDGISIRKGNKTNVYLFSIIAFFILLLACINFMIISTARSAGRAKEVGIRKMAGAFRRQLIQQFLSESIVLSILAIGLSIPIARLLMPVFCRLIGIEIATVFSSAIFLLFILLILALIVGILAGSYPAYFLSAFQPAVVLKKGIHGKSRGLSFRNILIVFQFIVSITLIVTCLVVYAQILFLRNNNPGFERENKVVIKNARYLWILWANESEKSGNEVLPEQRPLVLQSIKQELLNHSKVLGVTFSNDLPGRGGSVKECRIEGADADTKHKIHSLEVDPDYIRTLGLKLLSGRNYSSYRSGSDETPEGILVNETAVKYFGWTEPLGKNLIYRGASRTWNGVKNTYEWLDIRAPVIGVVKDYHFHSLYTEIQPMGFWPGGLDYIIVKIQPVDIGGTLEYLKKTWSTFAPDIPFEYSFLDDDLKSLYAKEERLGRIFLYFTLLAIFIASLGLFGLAAFTAQQRSKEIGVRKVMGASIQDIVRLLSRSYIQLIIVANIIAWPIGYMAMYKWLQNFAYRINIGIGIFLVTGIIALVIVVVAVSSQAIKASISDPVKSLQYE